MRRRIALIALGATLLILAVLFVRERRQPLSLLLVTIDTLRADHVGAYGDTSAQTPTLDALARRGTLFSHAHTAVPLTGPSHATILTGLYPPLHGVRDNATFVLGSSHPTLATLLSRKGYKTGGFVAGLPLVSAFGFGQGFATFDEEFHEYLTPGVEAKRPGNEVVDAALRFFSGVGKNPFFAWVHLYDPHAPYAPPPPFRERFRDRPYDGEIAFADAQLSRLLDWLVLQGRDRDTLVAVLSDHGEGLGDHGEATHGILIYESTLRVPLILSGPGVPAGRIVEDSVGTIDLLPTLLSSLGAEAPQGLPGRDLRPLLQGHEVRPTSLYSESLFGRLNCRWAVLRGLTEGRYKLIEGVGSELYDLGSDPSESRGLASEDPVLPRMKRVLGAALQTMAPQGDSARAMSLSPEQEERLRSLGYVGGGGGNLSLDTPGLPDPRTHVKFYERLQFALLSHGPKAVEALRDASEIASQDPNNPFATFTVASLAYRQGHLEFAEKAFAQTVALDPDRASTRSYYGHLLRDMGRLPDSERQLRVAVEETTPDDSRTRASLAETLVEEGKKDEAQGILSAILAKEPRHTEAHAALGRLLLNDGKAEDAIPHLKEASQGPDLEPAIELGEAYLATHEPEKARDAIGAVLARSPNHPWALGVLGEALILEGRRDEGLRTLKRAYSFEPRRKKVWLRLKEGFEVGGDRLLAERCEERAKAS